jgi:hypothetical protein
MPATETPAAGMWGNARHRPPAALATLEGMKRASLIAAARTLGVALALIVALALVAGVRPRVLAYQSGPPPLDSAVCLLCDGSASAALAAPSVDLVALDAAAVVLTLGAPTFAAHVAAATAPATLAVVPLPPPPRG